MLLGGHGGPSARRSSARGHASTAAMTSSLRPLLPSSSRSWTGCSLPTAARGTASRRSTRSAVPRRGDLRGARRARARRRRRPLRGARRSVDADRVSGGAPPRPRARSTSTTSSPASPRSWSAATRTCSRSRGRRHRRRCSPSGSRSRRRRRRTRPAPRQTRVLDGVPHGPALARAQKLGQGCGKVGFDWPGWEGSFAKVEEEVRRDPRRPCTAGKPAEIHHEIGDLLLAVVNLARKLGVDAEKALVDATQRFQRRFEIIEDRLAERGKTPQQSNLDEMDALWDEAKMIRVRRESDAFLCRSDRVEGIS